MASRSGAFAAPLALSLAATAPALPALLLGASALLAAVTVVVLMPETKGFPPAESFDGFDHGFNNGNESAPQYQEGDDDGEGGEGSARTPPVTFPWERVHSDDEDDEEEFGNDGGAGEGERTRPIHKKVGGGSGGEGHERQQVEESPRKPLLVVP